MKLLLLFIVLAAAGTLYALYMVVSPFLESRSDQLRHELLDREFERLERLTARKSAILQTLRDIETDYETGKLSEDDYRDLKREYEHEAVRVTREIDEARAGIDVEEDLEELLAERLEADERREKRESPGLECAECGASLDEGDRFCSQCGHPVDEANPSEPSTAEETSSESAEDDSTTSESDDASRSEDSETEEFESGQNPPSPEEESEGSERRSEVSG